MRRLAGLKLDLSTSCTWKLLFRGHDQAQPIIARRYADWLGIPVIYYWLWWHCLCQTIRCWSWLINIKVIFFISCGFGDRRSSTYWVLIDVEVWDVNGSLMIGTIRGAYCPSLWKAIRRSWTDLSGFIKAGNWKMISFWYDVWYGDLALKFRALIIFFCSS